MRPISRISCCVAILACASLPNKATAQNESSEERGASLREVSSAIPEIISEANLDKLRELIDNRITFDRNGKLYPDIECFFRWHEGCEFANTHVQEIAEGPHFIYYYHLSDNNVIVNYIREGSRSDFYINPSEFMSSRYLVDYFSCRFEVLNGVWKLQESVCFSETEGPFEAEPDV